MQLDITIRQNPLSCDFCQIFERLEKIQPEAEDEIDRNGIEDALVTAVHWLLGLIDQYDSHIADQEEQSQDQMWNLASKDLAGLLVRVEVGK